MDGWSEGRWWRRRRRWLTGVPHDAWYRFSGWLADTTHLTGSTLLGALVIAAVLGWLWHASR